LAVTPFIDGICTPSGDSATFQVICPANGRSLFSVPEGSPNDVERAVASGRAAVEDGRWADAAPSQRKDVLQRLADLAASESGALDALDAEEMGKPVSEAYCNAASAARLLRFYAEAVDKVEGTVYGSDNSTLVLQRRVPRGLVAAIVPWNFPTYNAILKVAPALAAGNCVILKPSELSSRSALRIAELALSAGLPAGVLNVVPGRGDIVGRALALH